MVSVCEEMGRMFSWSSMTTQLGQLARDSRKLERGGEGRGREGRGGEGRGGEGRGEVTAVHTGKHFSASPLIEPAHHVLVCLRAEPRVDIHRHGNQLPQGCQRSQENDDDSASFHSLHGAGQQVGRQSLKVLGRALHVYSQYSLRYTSLA